uniref:methyl-accepting chemotaxis protein n=1 Tax=Rossellomorea sedimentorum TaxID=3115294 RepID=UPI003F5465C1
MTENLSNLIKKTNDTVRQVAASSEELQAGAGQNNKAIEQISVAVSEVVGGADNQANSAYELTQSAQAISVDMQESSESMASMAKLADSANRKADRGIVLVTETVKQMNHVQESVSATSRLINELGSKSGDIGKIVEVITQLADQTNLLALNAAIEAARAGEQGKGFAVVADEVRKLAEQSGKAASDIQKLIEEIQKETNNAVNSMQAGEAVVGKGITMVNDTGNSFEDIAADIQNISRQSQEVNSIMQRVNEKSKGMNLKIESIAAITEQTSGSTQHVAASIEAQNAAMEEIDQLSRSLNGIARNLSEDLKQFQLS